MSFDTASYIFSVLATVLGLIEPFRKTMKKILLMSLGGNLFIGISYALVGSYSGCAICFIACVQLVINYHYAVLGKKVPAFMIGIYCLSFLLVGLLTFSAWFDVLSILASTAFALSISQKNPLFYRLIALTKNALWLAYDIASESYGALLTHILLSSAFILCLYFRREKDEADK